jgi:hypothetical protein
LIVSPATRRSGAVGVATVDVNILAPRLTKLQCPMLSDKPS